MMLEMRCTILLGVAATQASAGAAAVTPSGRAAHKYRGAPAAAVAAPALLPCDLYSAGGTPCVAAHSVSRALYAKYAGALFSVQRSSDNGTKDIGVVNAGGVADMVALDAFCPPDERCTVQRILDQSPWGNHIVPGSVGAQNGHSPLQGVNATKQRVMLAGKHRVPAAVIENDRPMGYRNDTTSGVPKGDAAESIYMVASGRHYNDGCCFDYGNAEPDIRDDGTGSMEAVYFGNASGGSMNHGGAGTGPWVQADLEKGLWSGNTTDTGEPSIEAEFVIGMVKGEPGRWALKYGDAQNRNGAGLTKWYEGVRPSDQTAGTKLPGGGHYSPMKKGGAVILGVGGDNSDRGANSMLLYFVFLADMFVPETAVGWFLEGAITSGYATDEVDAAVYANVVAAGYAHISA